MRVLLVHNSYQQRGGEDAVFEAERDLLRGGGHAVLDYVVSNDDVNDMGRVALAWNALWSRRNYKILQQKIAEFRPDVAHFHNTLPLVSPAAYYAAKRAGVPVVQTLHNYRLICPSALLFRDGEVCRKCVGKSLTIPALVHRCYRDSLGATATIAAMLALHRARKTYDKQVDRYIALTEFARDEHVRGGLPRERIVVKPNFLAEDPGVERCERHGALFVGRLTPEKGVRVLLAAMKRLDGAQRLTIIGDGPLREEVEQAAQSSENIAYEGPANRERVVAAMRRASVLAFPSVWFEGLPMTIVEAFAVGLPVLASNMGSMASLVEHERSGLLVAPGDAEAWAQAIARGDVAPAVWGQQARSSFEERYSPGQNLSKLEAIYQSLAPVANRGRISEPVSG